MLPSTSFCWIVGGAIESAVMQLFIVIYNMSHNACISLAYMCLCIEKS